MSACRSCGAPVRWLRTYAGKAMPLDETPSPVGNVDVEDGRAVVLGPSVAALRRAAGEELFTSHFATCPQAKGWRSR